MLSSRHSVRRAGQALRDWRGRQWWVAGAGALATAVVVGVPTAVVPNPLFARSVPTQWWNYPALALTCVLAGIVLSTYVRRPDGSGSVPPDGPGGRTGVVGAVLSFLAVGCPVCNKLVLVLVGASGALSYWAPVQPLLAVVSLGLLAEAAVRRLTAETVCPVQVSA